MLTVDLGNSRLKALQWSPCAAALPSAAAFRSGPSWEGAAGALAEFERWLARERPPLAAFSSVAARDQTKAVQELLAARCAHLIVAPDCGLENRCGEPERVGADRLYAAAGAATLFERSCIVVDAGTALTVDALFVEGATRAFLGGAIAPGPVLAATVLAEATARLPRIEPRAGARALGRVTEDALQAGVVVGFRGAAERLVEEIAQESGILDALVVLTGGAREFLLVPGPFTRRAFAIVPELVHRGLLAALLRDRDRLGAP